MPCLERLHLHKRDTTERCVTQLFVAAQRAKQQFIILTYDIVFGGKISIHLTALDCPIRPHCLTRFATRILCGIWLHSHMFSSRSFFPRGDRSGVCEGYNRWVILAFYPAHNFVVRFWVWFLRRHSGVHNSWLRAVSFNFGEFIRSLNLDLRFNSIHV